MDLKSPVSILESKRVSTKHKGFSKHRRYMKKSW